MCGFDRKQAVEYSFILSLPAIIGSAVLKVGDAIKLLPTVEIGPYLVGMVVAAVSGYLAIKLVELLVSKDKFGAFAYYCAAVGIFSIIYAIVTR
jgi:undecaprenyl-diphosphatase